MAKIKEAKKRKKAGSATQSSGAARDYLKEGIVVMNAARGMVGDLELEYGKKYKKKGRRVKRNVSMAGNDATPAISFKVNRGGKQKVYPVQGGYGYFIPSLRKAGNLAQVTALVERGLQSKDVNLIIEYLDLKILEIAKAASVSPSTVSRWQPETSIGIPGSSQFFKIDELIKKGVDLFGGLAEFKSWLTMPNIALGNELPSTLITSPIGIALLDEAIDALHFGNVM